MNRRDDAVELEQTSVIAEQPRAKRWIPPIGTLIVSVLTLCTAIAQSIWNGDQIAQTFGLPSTFTEFQHSLSSVGPILGCLKLFTYVFPHGGWWHVLPNVMALFVFGAIVESSLGTRKLLLSYFASGAVGAFCKWVVPPHPPGPIAGASLAIAGLLGFYISNRCWNTSLPLAMRLRAPILVMAATVATLFWLYVRDVPAEGDLACSVAYHLLPFLAMSIGVHLFHLIESAVSRRKVVSARRLEKG